MAATSKSIEVRIIGIPKEVNTLDDGSTTITSLESNIAEIFGSSFTEDAVGTGDVEEATKALTSTPSDLTGDFSNSYVTLLLIKITAGNFAYVSLDSGSTYPIKLSSVNDAVLLRFDNSHFNSIYVKSGTGYTPTIYMQAVTFNPV